MLVCYKKIVKVDELAHLVPRNAGSTFSQLWQIFYYTRLFKYVKFHHYAQIKTSFNKICTFNKLQELCDLGYLKSPQSKIYCATDKVLPILKEAGFNTKLLPSEPTGKGYINEINNSDVFVQAIKLPHFYTLLYCNFNYLIPDALLVQLDRVNKRYKLTFLEIEAKKPDWETYIEVKHNNYLKLAKDILLYEYWSAICQVLDLPKPSLNSLKFSVNIIGKIKKNWGKDFNFMERL